MAEFLKFDTMDANHIKTSQDPSIATKNFVDAKIAGVEAKIAEAKFQTILWAFVF